MNVRVGVTVAVVAALLVGAGPIAAAAEPLSSETERTQASPFTLQGEQIDADEVRMDVSLRPNGTAEWSVEFWMRLDDNESATAFESLRDDIRDDPGNHTQAFADRMRDTVSTASNATGREMSVDGFAVATDRQSFAREYGVVRYTFRWHGFAAVEGDELRAGDALEGIYLDDGTRLLIAWPDGYERTSVAPEPDEERDRAVLWRGGETDFVSGEPRVVVTAAGSGLPTAALAAVAVVLFGGAIGGWWYYTRRVRTDDGGPDPGPAPEAESARAGRSGTDSPPSATAGDESPNATATDSPDPELLSNEEQVLRLLRERGGRMKQQAVVEELDWTDAKTSKVVSGLRDEGKLESFRLGRENVLSLPGADDEIVADADGDGAE
ncbi:hypothetical protein [Natrinema sp. 1APR25-10V2]|uniref:DUF7345 domain-containing protein n=1 Tax=Natrinema sp. 1APR25-10V2 TaxID=2951081 RepID=UPI002876909E|nr:hypothetical protein [Natrinema sp. 1APR25-10V2]MDS0476405.1 hypothetical protein [Natrinema sp. 1APR25-10V2]